jgi:arylsulfatase A-like enzyme
VVGLDPADPITVQYGEKIGDEPTGSQNPELLKMKPSHGHDMTIVNGISRIGYMAGGKAARWVDEDMADTITRKAVAYVEQHQEKPFFLFFPTHDIHVPRVPHPRFVGKTEMGPRGDALVQLDWCVGEILSTLDRLKLTEKTLIIFSSDNGPVVDDGYQDEAVTRLRNHKPAGPLRGGKYSNFEAGTRVPFITWWPGRIQPGKSAALVCQIDLTASLAALTGVTLPDDAAPDSLNILPALFGESTTGRDTLVEHGNQLALRQGSWKYIPPGKGPKRQNNTGIEAGKDPAGLLFDLSTDLGEKKSLVTEQPERAAAMAEVLREIQQAGRSRP